MSLFNHQHKDREHERYYLFPGQGGSMVRRKQRMMIVWALAVGLTVSAVLGFAIWWVNTHGH
ncbi:MAG: hypothetical protein RLZZ350_2601 [Verrucomicrobiota bacterium]